MVPDFMYSLKDENLYYEISNKLIELWELEKEERVKLSNSLAKPPVLLTYRPSLAQLEIYKNDLLNYQKAFDEYKALKHKLDSNKSWQEIINVYVSSCYTNAIPIGLIEKFIFNKYKLKPYADIFEAYIEMIDWFEENNIIVVEGNNDSSD